MHYTTSCNTQSSAPEEVQNNCPKHVELTGIINKPLLLHLVGCLSYLYFIIFFCLAKQSQFIPLQNVVYFITLPVWFVKYSHFTEMVCYYLNIHFLGQRVNLQHGDGRGKVSLARGIHYRPVLLFLLPDQRLCIVKNVCVCVYTMRRLYMNYRCFQITLQ